MPSRTERCLCRALHVEFADFAIGGTRAEYEPVRKMMTSLEWFVPEVLRELYPEWNSEALDGVWPFRVRKVDRAEAEVFGACYLMNNQKLAPLHVSTLASTLEEEISWFECELGIRGRRSMVGFPSMEHLCNHFYHFNDVDPDILDWPYRVTFGSRGT